MYDGNIHATGGCIAGEVKLVFPLHLLAGGDVLDLAVIFYITADTYHNVMYEFLLNWVIKTSIVNMDIKRCLGNKDAMARVSAGFSKISIGVIKGAIGAIGAIDGWLVRIVRPSWRVGCIKM